MPKRPKKIERVYRQNYESFERKVKNDWFYNSPKWRKFSKAFKRRNKFCVECKKQGRFIAATVTDHLKQYSPGGPGWDLNNLNDVDFQALCDKCHNARSGRQRHI